MGQTPDLVDKKGEECANKDETFPSSSDMKLSDH